MHEEIIKDIRRVLSSLAVISPFSYPILMMPIEFRQDLNFWAGTNGTTFFCNPDKWTKLTFKQKMFVAMHEWLHVALQHPKRMQGRKKKIWTIASDYVVNDIIISDLRGQYSPPPGIYYDKSLSNKTVEQIYKLLISELDKKEPGQSKKQTPDVIKLEDAVNLLQQDDNIWGNDLEQPSSSVDNQQLIDAIIKAAARTKSMKKGRLPSRYEEYIDTLKKSTIPWERILFRFSKKILKGTTDRNPYKPDPKYLPFDIIVPTEQTSKIGKLVFIVDTSASMQREEFEYVCGHLEKLGTLVDKCTVITSDVVVQEVIRVKRIKKTLKDRDIKFKGRGGSDMSKAFELAETMHPDLIILYSDMMLVRWPNKPKRSQTIFLATANSPVCEPPFGIFIKVKKDD